MVLLFSAILQALVACLTEQLLGAGMHWTGEDEEVETTMMVFPVEVEQPECSAWSSTGLAQGTLDADVLAVASMTAAAMAALDMSIVPEVGSSPSAENPGPDQVVADLLVCHRVHFQPQG